MGCYRQPACSSMLLLLTLLLSYGVGTSRCSMVSENSTDMLSLLEFKQAITNDPTGALNSWNARTPFCQWGGVTCSSTHPGRVTRLDLADRRLTGSIAASLGNLTFLRLLNLSRNSFSGELPHLNRLHKLQFLMLANNSLGGVIPDTLMNCSNLQQLHLGNNALYGEIPLKIGFLSNLDTIVLSKNSFTGIIPATLSNISCLEKLGLSYNHLTGTIPPELGQLPSLQHLLLGSNNLSGTIPDALLNISSIQYLGLEINNLHKALPLNIGNSLSKLIQITAGYNRFEGPIPASLGNASHLIKIDMSSNMLTGPIPSSLGNLTQLQWLNFEKNLLEANNSKSWEFLDALGNCKQLQVFSLSSNRLQGDIPNSVGKLSSKLQILAMSINHLSGTVPTSIGNLTGLSALELDENNLTGTIEEWVGNLKKLQVLNLQKNSFHGFIPPSIGNFKLLSNLSLAENEFNGFIPSELGYLGQLSRLDLSSNNLRGNIPAEIFQASAMTTLVLSQNKLEGPIPPEVSNLVQLTQLDLSSNNLSGEIPSALGKCQGLQIIQIEQNFFTGNIPESFGDLPVLSVLNLSHNELSGSIPPTLSQLQLLNSLDLSYNHLEGKIPRTGVFANATAVSLNSNWGLCGGSSDLHMPPCSSVSQTTKVQYYLVRTLIPIFGFLSLILLIYFVFLEKNKPMTYASSLPFGEQFPKVSYMDLADATSNFSNMVGKGSYGSVYRGKLIPSKLEVAVKVLDLEMRGAERSFISECEALRGIQHRNLLPIITVCSTVDSEGNAFKALVYEYMPNGNLDTWLHQNGDGKSAKRLDLVKRISIAANIADALDYLHHDTAGRPIIHCDLKPSNVLLDDDMNAHLGDFGIASFYYHSTPASVRDSISSIGLKGTIGYIAPEYAGGCHPSTSGDVYSFGIILLEMLTGKRPTDPMFADGRDIVNYVQGNYNGRHTLLAIDAELQEECNVSQDNKETESTAFRCLSSMLEVAISCARQSPTERISMREAAIRLSAIKSLYVEGKNKHSSLR